MEGTETNKTEEATPHKLEQARKKGQVARGTDLGYVSTIIAFTAFFVIFGASYLASIADMMRETLTIRLDSHSQPEQVLLLASLHIWQLVKPLLYLFGIVVIVVIFFEMLQLRGFVFSTHPIKPDFTKLNPVKGLKRVFSIRMLKETFKNVIKLAIYLTAAYYFIRYSIDEFGLSILNGYKLAGAMEISALRILLMFLAIGFFVMIIDQIIVRKEFSKQMRMGRSEVVRESKDREGDPRQKQKRKQLHKEYTAQNSGLGNVAGSDVVIANPHHYAVALAYKPETMEAPTVTAKGRNKVAQAIKQTAFLHGVSVIENRPLAQALYKSCKVDQEIPDSLYDDVATIFVSLRQRADGSHDATDEGDHDAE